MVALLFLQVDPATTATIVEIAMGLFFVPRFVIHLFSAVGRPLRRFSKRRANWGRLLGLLMALLVVGVFAYGRFFEANRIVVKQMEMTFSNLPDAFDGYRIVTCSDLHIGSLPTDFVDRLVETVNLQRADAIFLLGDVQNAHPQELYPYASSLRKLHATDGVFSVLGNHDYSYYAPTVDEALRIANERETVSRQQQAGWAVLDNSHQTISRQGQQLYVAGTAFFADKRRHLRVTVPNKADIDRALEGIPPSAFTILLQHNPTEWKSEIAGRHSVALTLSGHTHGGQLQLFGLRPSRLLWSEDSGLYSQGHQRLYVTTGLGGVFRFRFNVPPEVVVITLRKS